MRFLTLAALAVAFPAAARADTKPIPTVPYGEAKPAGHQAVTPAPVPAKVSPAPITVAPGAVAIVPAPTYYSVPVLPPVVPPVGPVVLLPDGSTRIPPAPLADGTIRFGPGTTLGERLQYYSLVHNHAPDGTLKPVGAGNAWTEFKFAFGSARQFFGTAGATVGYGRWTREP